MVGQLLVWVDLSLLSPRLASFRIWQTQSVKLGFLIVYRHVTDCSFELIHCPLHRRLLFVLVALKVRSKSRVLYEISRDSIDRPKDSAAYYFW
jgi:hypothetical protein